MNENRVLKVEKKKTNIVGIIIIVIVFLGLVGYGTYYYIKNKEYISFYLPWSSKEDKEKVVKVRGLKTYKDENYPRTEVDMQFPYTLYDGVEATILLNSIKLNDGAYDLNISINNRTLDKLDFSIDNIYLDSNDLRLTAKKNVNYNSTETLEYSISKDVLDRYRINSFGVMKLFMSTVDYSGSKNEFSREVESGNVASTKALSIEEITKVHGIKFSYYKAQESKDDYLLYFLVENNNDNKLSYYYSKFILDDREFDASEYSGSIDKNMLYVEVIKIPKKQFLTIKELTISIIVFEKDSVYESKEVVVTL